MQNEQQPDAPGAANEEKTNVSYIIESLVGSLAVLKAMMEDLSPRQYYTVAELAERFPEFSNNKVYRIIKTFESVGWVEKHPTSKSYKIGHDLLYLSHRYFQKLHEEVLFYKTEINSFNVK